MSLEREIIQLLERFRDTQCGGKANRAADNLGITAATFSRWVTGTHLPKIESLIVPFNRLNARIITGDSAEEKALARRCRELEAKLEDLKKLIEAKDEVIRLQKELMSTLKNADLEAEGTEHDESVYTRRPLQLSRNGTRNKD